MFSEVGCLKLELLRSERLSESFSGGPDELRIAYDLLDLGSGAVATHVVFLEYLLQGHIRAHAFDDVVEDLLLTLGEGGGPRAAEEPLPKGSSLAHLDV
jgi:hypothetical protein